MTTIKGHGCTGALKEIDGRPARRNSAGRAELTVRRTLAGSQPESSCCRSRGSRPRNHKVL
jgi:hypothetical protein